MDNNEIKKIIREVLEFTTVPFIDIDIFQDSNGTIFTIQTNEPHLLIGNRGSTLLALNYLVKRIINNRTKEPSAHFIVDVNNYQQERNKDIQNKARIFADRVRSFSSDVEMEPMGSYERMVVHSALAEQEDIETESTGIGKNRRVVIRLKK